MTGASYLPLVQQLASFEPRAYVFGGIAEDALLDGRITRPHGDVDVLVARAALDQHRYRLRAIGFSDFEVYFESPPGMPLVLGSAFDGLSVELGVFDELEPGIASFVLPVTEGSVRITLPDDTLQHPVSYVDEVPIRTVSPRALYHLREAFIFTGAFGPVRDKDREAQARLRRELLATVPDSELTPKFVPIA